jgi:hypothetical protein
VVPKNGHRLLVVSLYSLNASFLKKANQRSYAYKRRFVGILIKFCKEALIVLIEVGIKV